MLVSVWSFPAIVDEQSLYVFLHDADVQAVTQDLLQRTLSVRFSPAFPKPSIPVPERIELTMSDVTHVCVFEWKPWPGQSPVFHPSERVRYEEESKAFMERSSWTTTSVPELAEKCGVERVEVLEASLCTTNEGIALQWVDQSGTIDFRCAGRTATWLADGHPVILDELIRLGTLGWEEWKTRGKP